MKQNRSFDSDKPTLLVASCGGHLEQLRNLYQRFEPTPSQVEWVTHAGEQLASLKAAGHAVHEVPYLGPRDYKALAANMPQALELVRSGRFSRVVSTGAGIAIPYAVAAKISKTPYHYIESQTRLKGPSFTGKVLSKFPHISLYAQNKSWSGAKWLYRGSGLDGYTPRRVAPPARISRIVVTLGTMRRFSFRRAVEQLLRLIPTVAAADAEVLWQTGCTDVTGLGIEAHENVPTNDLREAIASADLVFTHAGVGSALVALQHGKAPIVMPRQAAFDEHVDDHQQLLADELYDRGLAIAASPNDLSERHVAAATSTRISRAERPPTFRLQAQ